MATVTPTISSTNPWLTKITWAGMATGDTIVHVDPGRPAALAGSLQVLGDLGGGTLALEGSNDGETFAPLSDLQGDPISLAAAGIAEFSTAVQYIRPVPADGTDDDVTAIIVLRG